MKSGIMRQLQQLLLLLLLLRTSAVKADSWIWSTDNPDEGVPGVPSASRPIAVEDDRKARTLEGDRKSQGRFFDIKNRLCDLGLGLNCHTGYAPATPTYFSPGPTNQPTYAAPAPSYHPPKAVPPLKPTYTPPVSAFRPSKPDYTPAVQPAHRLPANAYPAHGSDAQVKPSVVHHIHTHTHIHEGSGPVNLGKELNVSPGVPGPPARPGTPFNTGAHVPVAQPRPPTHTGTSFNPVSGSRPLPPLEPIYREDCVCIPHQFCQIQHIVARTSTHDIRNLIDARIRPTSVLSNATEVDGVTTTFTPYKGNVRERRSSRRAKVFAFEDNPQGSSGRHRRDILRHDATVSKNPTGALDVQGRQFGAHRPGHGGCDANLVCCTHPDYPPPRPAYSCGKRNTGSIQGRIKTPYFEQGDTQFGEYPWQVALLKDEYGEGVYVCGGVLIDDQHVLTAAHCVDDLRADQMIVRLGEWDVSGNSEFYDHFEVKVSHLYVHPDYYAGNLYNNIAVLRLYDYVDLETNPHVSPVCLPDGYVDFTGQHCHVTGWGKDAFGERGNFQHILKEVDVPVIGRYQCQEALRGTVLGRSFNLEKGSICAGGEEGKDACKGDGGSPLVCLGADGAFELAGLVSWGIGCGNYGVPGVYVNVPYFLDWIRSVTRR